MRESITIHNPRRRPIAAFEHRIELTGDQVERLVIDVAIRWAKDHKTPIMYLFERDAIHEAQVKVTAEVERSEAIRRGTFDPKDEWTLRDTVMALVRRTRSETPKDSKEYELLLSKHSIAMPSGHKLCFLRPEDAFAYRIGMM